MYAEVHRRACMHRDDDGETTRGDARFEQIVDPVVIGMEDLGCARFDRSLTQTSIAGDDRVLAHLDHEVGGARGAIAIDHEPRVTLQDQGRIEPGGEPARDLRCADVPRNVAFEIGVGQAQRSQPCGQRATPVLAGQEERRRSRRTYDFDRRRIAGDEQVRVAAILAGLHSIHPQTPARAKRAQCTKRRSHCRVPRRRACRAPDCFDGDGDRRGGFRKRKGCDQSSRSRTRVRPTSSPWPRSSRRQSPGSVRRASAAVGSSFPSPGTGTPPAR